MDWKIWWIDPNAQLAHKTCLYICNDSFNTNPRSCKNTEGPTGFALQGWQKDQLPNPMNIWDFYSSVSYANAEDRQFRYYRSTDQKLAQS